MVFAVNPGAEGSANSFSAFKAAALAIGAQLASLNGTNTTTASGSGASPSASSISGSGKNGAISMNTGGANAMLMAGLGMVVSLMFDGLVR